MKRWRVLAVAGVVIAWATATDAGERRKPAPGEPVCDPPQSIYRPPVRKGDRGGLIMIPGRCSAPTSPARLLDDLMADILDPAVEDRPDPTYTPDGVAAAVDLLFEIAAETGPALSYAELKIDPQALVGSGLEHCRRRPLGLRCETSFNHDLEAGRAYARVLGAAVARRQSSLGWTIGEWKVRERAPKWTDLEARGAGHPNAVAVSKLEADYGDGRPWVGVDLTINGDGPP